MTGGQENSGDEQILTTKSDADFYFLPYLFLYWRSYLAGWIQTGWQGPWSSGTGSHIYWEWSGWRLYFGWQTWILSRASDGTFWDTFLILKRLMDGEHDLGPVHAVSILEMIYVVLGKHPSLFITSWSSKQHGGWYMRSTERGSWVAALICRHIGDPSVILCAPTCLCVWNDKYNFLACTKINTKVGGRDRGGQ